MPQLTLGQRTFLVEKNLKTQSINEVIPLFEERFSDQNPSYGLHRTSLKRNRGNSGRKRTAKNATSNESSANLEMVDT